MVCFADQLGCWDAQSVADAEKGCEGWLPYSALQPRNERAIHAGVVGKFFLRNAHCVAMPLQHLAKSFTDRRATIFHAGDFRVDVAYSPRPIGTY